jgi:hypothetical protein
MAPQFHEDGKPVQHALEARFNASAWDILTAIEKGFRAQVDVKGKLAELFLYRHLLALQNRGTIGIVEWRDKDGVPDFGFTARGTKLQAEVKNVRSGREVFPDAFKVEIQKTRNRIEGGPSRGYRVDEFNILAACLFNQTGEWQFLFSSTINLDRRANKPDYMVVMKRVLYTAKGHWRATLEDAITDVLGP